MNALRKNALAIYKRSILESWLIGLFSGILIAAILAINIFVPSLSIILVPFVVLPILFSAILSHIRLRYNEPLAFSKTLKQFILFFRFPFNSSFSYIGSFFKSLVVFLGFTFLGSSLGLYLTTIFRPGISDSLSALQDILNKGNGITMEEVQDLLAMNDYALFFYLSIIILPATFFFSLVLIYFVTRNATGVYLRTNIKSNNPQFIKLVQNYVYARYRMKMFKKYMYLNWPLLVLYALGYIDTCIFMLFNSKSVLDISAYAIAGGTLAMSLYLPFYYCNMEAIYSDSALIYSEGLEYITSRILRNMEMNNKNMEEEKRKFEDIVKNNDIENDNDNEKDPPMGS